MADIITNKINWFPGHMKKATDDIKKIVKAVDLVIEVLDTRCLKSTSNEELLKLVEQKPILHLGLKSDLADLKDLKIEKDKDFYLIGSLKQKEFKNKIILKMNELLKPKFEKYKSKGLMVPKFLVLVVGLPNVGKSSLINFLQDKKRLIVENRPGVTKKQTITAINQNYNLVDTPGVLFKNIDHIDTAYKLSLIHCIKKEVLNIEDILKYAFNQFLEKKPEALFEFYKVEKTQDFYQFLDLICQRYQYFLPNNVLDYQRAYDKLFNDISLAKVAKITWEEIIN